MISRFSGADQPGWAPPGEDELGQHFSDGFLAALPSARLIEVIGRLAADLLDALAAEAAAPPPGRRLSPCQA